MIKSKTLKTKVILKKKKRIKSIKNYIVNISHFKKIFVLKT